MLEKYHMTEHRQDKGVMTSMSCVDLTSVPAPRSVIAGCPQLSSETTLHDKSGNLKKHSRTMKSSKTLEVDLTLNGKDLQPFWNEFCREMSKRLWLPTETDSVDLVSSSLSTLLKGTAEKSWFSTIPLYRRSESSSKTYYQSSTHSHVDCMVLENTVVRSRKIKIYPTAEQRIVLRRILGISRYAFNQTIDYLRQPDTMANWMSLKTTLIKQFPAWAAEAPYQVRSISIKEACNAVNLAKRKYKATGKFNEVHFRSKKSDRQSCYLPKSAIDKNGLFKKLLGTMKYAEELPDIAFDCRLVSEYGKWFVVVPVEQPIEILKTKEPIVSLDPGVRTFMTYYSLNEAGLIGNKAWERILCLGVRADSLCKRIASKSIRARKRQNLRRALKRLRYRIACLQQELHAKTATMLCKHYKLIVIPQFSAGQMNCRTVRRLRSKTVRSMMSLAHSKFRTLLLGTAKKYGSLVCLVNEAYTSKTCGSCGRIHETLGSSEHFKCPECGASLHRDVNGARNIMLRAMLDQTTNQ